jgi:hypothetical protein
MAYPAEQNTDQQAQDAQYYRRVLHDLIDIGADLARLIHRQAQLQAEPTVPAANPRAENSASGTSDTAQTMAPPPAVTMDPTIAFDRIARAVRRTIMLAQKLAEPTPVHIAARPRPYASARKPGIDDIENDIQRRVIAIVRANRVEHYDEARNSLTNCSSSAPLRSDTAQNIISP